MNPAPDRRHDLDWIRVCAFGLLVVYHVGMYYVSWDFHVKSPHAGTFAEPLMLLSSPWRLSLLFLVSGAATAFMLGKGRAGFLRQRSWRLLLPLLFGMLVIVPPQSYYQVVEQLGYHDGYLAFWGRYLRADHGFCRDGDCLTLPTWNHLWFVAYLWVYTAILYAALRLAPALMQGAGRRVAARLAAGWGLLLWPAALLALARITLADRFGSTHALAGDWYNHAQYFPIFVLGYFVARETAVWERMRQLRRPALLLALGSWAIIALWYALYLMDARAATLPPDTLLVPRRVLWGMNQWSAIVAICGYARQWAPGDSPALRYLVPAVFPIYILHQTLIIIFAHNMQVWNLPPAIEAPLLIALTFAGCFAGYELIRRVGWLRPLFGLKREMPGRVTRGAAVVA
ncbi:MAG: acyltransferase family protein [Solimonas sp.]